MVEPVGSTRPTRAQKKDLTRSQILDAAAAVFPVRGFHRTSVDDIARHAGLTSGAVYSNFAGKAELFLALYQRQMDRWVDEVSSLVPDDPGPRSQARAAGVYWSTFLHQEHEWFLLHMEFWAHVMREPDLGPRYALQFRRLRTAIADALEASAAANGLALPLPAADLAAAVQGLNRGLLIEALADPGSVPDELFGAFLDRFANARPLGRGESRQGGKVS